MERKGPRNFSIGSYISEGGILGDKLEVDEAAASSIMKRTALRRDIVIRRGFYREKYEFEGSDELAVSTASMRNPRNVREVGQSELSTLVCQGDEWQMFVHDQQIGDKINDWMNKNHKQEGQTYGQGQAVFSEKFVERLRREVNGGLRSAFWNEKREIFSYPFMNSRFTLLIESVQVWLIFNAVISMYQNNPLSGDGYSRVGLANSLLISF